MGEAWLLATLAYLSVAVFAGGVVLRAAKYARAPMHLRWELYPVPHEKGKEYGGSYFEEVDWWTRPRETTLWGEIRSMLEEILLIRSLWHRNRPQWYASFPFHVGLYLLVGFTGLLTLGALAEALGLAAGAASPLWDGYHLLTTVVGVVGLFLGTVGACCLLWRRAADQELKAYSTISDYTNLVFLLAVFLSAGFAWLSVDSSFGLLREYVRGLITLSPVAAADQAVAVQVSIASLFLLYLPFTHMTHFVAKYFTYHQVRWDDAPNLGYPKMLARMQANLARPVGWAGPHIEPEKSWAESATAEVK